MHASSRRLPIILLILTSCDLIAPFMNNRRTTDGTGIKCLLCEGDKCKEGTTGYMLCATRCCFSMSTYQKSGVFNKRGCAPGKLCKDFCDAQEKLKTDVDFLSCDTCGTDNCNSHELYGGFECYQCSHCNEVTVATPMVPCRSPECCYTAYLNTANAPLYAVRDCVEWSKGLVCTPQVVDAWARRKFLRKSLLPRFDKAVACTPNASSGCNRQTYQSTDFTCHTCNDGDDCSEVAVGAAQTSCPDSTCCYAMATYGTVGGIRNERGCTATVDVQCTNYCSTIKMEPGRVMLHCQNCNENGCNKDKLIKKFQCYQCDRCNTVDDYSLVSCISPLCCYTWYKSDYLGGPLFAYRGCLNDLTKNCSNNHTVDEMNKRLENETLKDKHITVCPENALTKCNGKAYIPPLHCYNCFGDNCAVVRADTNTTECNNGCCFSVSTIGKNHEHRRDCVPTVTDCTNFCDTYNKTVMEKHRRLLSCESCDSFKCNKVDLKPRFQCYQCKHCNNVTSHPVDCVSPSCCYVAYVKDNPAENWYATRGCAPDTFDERWCKSTCLDVKNTHLTRNLYGDFLSCTTCDIHDVSGCNNESYVPPAMCYECFGCVDTGVYYTNLTKCPSQCCFSSSRYTKETGLRHTRGCCQHYHNSSSTDFCKHYEVESNSTFCKACGEYKCNNDELAAPFYCYSCTNCNTIKQDTPTIHCRYPKCCYTAFLRDNEEGPFYAVRGCLEETTCDLTCYVVERNHYLLHPIGEVLKCTTCYKNDTNNCNKQPFNPTSVTNPKPEDMSCYTCRKCNRVSHWTPTVLCYKEECCYRAALSDHPMEPYFAVRGCYRLRFNQTCEHACSHVKHRHHLAHPNGSFHVCIHCDEGDEKNCNSGVFKMPKTAVVFQPKHSKRMRCYKCTNCNHVTKITTDVHCANPECCYSALINNRSDEKLYGIRNCNTRGDCSTTCADFKRRHLEEHTNGTMFSCTTCKVNDTNECNDMKYDPPPSEKELKAEQEPGINCYACRDCNRITAISGSLPCKNSECCYRALLSVKREEDVFAVRGCARMRRGQSCNNTCRYLENKHHLDHPRGLFLVCVQCREDDVAGCNDKIFYSPTEITSDQRAPGAVMCYNCKNCSRITPRSERVECRAARCCYVAHVKNHRHDGFYTIRGCARWKRKKPCVNSCKDLENDFLWEHPLGVFSKCLTCKDTDGDNCNRIPLNPPKVIPEPPHTGMTCYQCIHCYTVNRYTPTTTCDSPRCCYTALLKNHVNDSHYISRGCNKYCMPATACRDARNHHIWEYPLGSFLHCITCNDDDPDECNNKPYVPPRATTVRPLYRAIYCYACSNCNAINSFTPTTLCRSPKCCYTILATTDPFQQLSAHRGCITNPNCTTTCRAIKTQHLHQHPTGSFDYCMTCNIAERDRCNKNNYNPPLVYVTPSPFDQPDYPMAIPHDFNHHPQPQHPPSGGIRCFNCTHCGMISMDTQKIPCGTGCCFTLALHGSNVIRGCLDNICIQDNCNRVHPNKREVVSCSICTTDKCNMQRF